MMKNDLLLQDDLAKELYSRASSLPLIDYHNHLSIPALAENRTELDPAALWLTCDPYKHRAMRICGVEEKYITGDTDAFDKFRAWCAVYPRLAGNPLCHWAELELSEYFDLDLRDFPINGENARALWDVMDRKLHGGRMGIADILRRAGMIYSAPCMLPTDTPPDSAMPEGIRVVPSLRADTALAPDAVLLQKLAEQTGSPVRTVGDYKAVLRERLRVFEEHGCNVMDISLDAGFRYREETVPDTAAAEDCGREELAGEMLRFFGVECRERGWVLLLHIGALRQTSPYLKRVAGAAGGFAGIGASVDPDDTVRFLRSIEAKDGSLPKTLLFCLNPADTVPQITLSGSFAHGQVGPGAPWWWNDHLQGMTDFMEWMSCYGVLSAFFGMTTDSRSALSMVRHDYFRRTLCRFLARKVRAGEFPADRDVLGDLIDRVCFRNAADKLLPVQ